MPFRIDNNEFLKTYESFAQVLTDKKLAALGDAYVNFVYSLAMSKKLGKPFGKKMKGVPLATAVRKADLRRMLPSRIDKHDISDSAEALLVYGWLRQAVTLEETVEKLEKCDKLEIALAQLLRKTAEQIRF